MKYTIYHIPAKQKIGLTYRDAKIRVREQGYKEFEILEVHYDYDFAIEREIILQKEYGYNLDRCKYDLERLSENGKQMGAINGKLNKGKKHNRPKKQKIKIKIKKEKTLHTNSKLTENDVRFIRKSDLTQSKLAIKFNTTQVTINNVINRKYYKWIL